MSVVSAPTDQDPTPGQLADPVIKGCVVDCVRDSWEKKRAFVTDAEPVCKQEAVRINQSLSQTEHIYQCRSRGSL